MEVGTLSDTTNTHNQGRMQSRGEKKTEESRESRIKRGGIKRRKREDRQIENVERENELKMGGVSLT